MTPVDRGPNFAPSPQAIAIVRERLQQLGLPISEAAVRGLLEAVLAIEGPRLHSQVRGAFENSLEIIRDTAESALGGATDSALSEAKGKRVARSDHEDEPRPVFKRPRR